MIFAYILSSPNFIGEFSDVKIREHKCTWRRNNTHMKGTWTFICIASSMRHKLPSNYVSCSTNYKYKQKKVQLLHGGSKILGTL